MTIISHISRSAAEVAPDALRRTPSHCFQTICTTCTCHPRLWRICVLPQRRSLSSSVFRNTSNCSLKKWTLPCTLPYAVRIERSICTNIRESTWDPALYKCATLANALRVKGRVITSLFHLSHSSDFWFVCSMICHPHNVVWWTWKCKVGAAYPVRRL